MIRRPVDARFFSTVRMTSACWLWLAHAKNSGYGEFFVDSARPRELAHRYSYERLIGPIPDGLVIDHLCRNVRCVRPDHLEAVTSRENTLRGTTPAAVNATKTHCVRGHPFSVENTYVYPSGERRCRTCKRASDRVTSERSGCAA